MEDKNKKIKKKRIINIIVGLVFVFGLLVLIYPIISRIYYRIEANEEIHDFDRAKNLIDEREVEERIKLAQIYNDTLINDPSEDPYGEGKIKEARKMYAQMLEVHEKIGHIQIPAIDIDIPIYAGTSENILQIGAGHLEGTSLPIGGNSTHTVITAHSGLPSARLFTDLEKLKIGDKFYIHNVKEILAYQVDSIDIIEPSDFSKLLIDEGHDYATLLTCTPLMINTHRLLVRGHRVEYIKEVEERIIGENRVSFIYRYLFYISLILIGILILLILRLRSKKRKAERKYREFLKEDGGDINEKP